MNRIFLCPIFFIAFTASFAQTIVTHLPQNADRGFCRGAKFNVPFTASGNFGPNNQFKVQIVYHAIIDGDYRQLVLPLDGQSTGGSVQVSIPDTVTTINTFQVRVVSTEPVVKGNVTNESIPINYPLSVSFSDPKITNPNELTYIYYGINGKIPGKIYLSDSSSIDVTSSGSNYFLKGPSQTTTYSIIKTENICGISIPKQSSSVTLPVNQIGFKLIKVETLTPCRSGSIFITYDTDKPFNPDNEFKVNIGYSFIVSPHIKRTIEVVCKEFNKNTLRVEIPSSFHWLNIRLQSFQLTSSSPAMTLVNSDTPLISFFSNPFLHTTSEINVPYGSEGRFSLVKQPSDTYDEEIYVTDGKDFSYFAHTAFGGYDGNAMDIKTNPDADTVTTYRVYTPYKNCNDASEYHETKVNLLPGLKLLGAPKITCKDTRIQFKYRSNIKFQPDNQFHLHFEYDGIRSAIRNQVTMVNDSIVEFILSEGYFTVYFPKSAEVTVVLTSLYPQLTSNPIKIQLQRAPTFAPSYDHITVEEGGMPTTIQGSLTGGGPYTYLVDDGTYEYTTSNLTFTSFASTVYQIKKISNACGSTEYKNLKFNVDFRKSVEQAIYYPDYNPDFYANFIKVCAGSNTEIPFRLYGQTDLSDEFHFQIGYYDNEMLVWETVGSSKQSPIKFIFPTDLPDKSYLCRIYNPTKDIAWNYNSYLRIMYLPQVKILSDQGEETLIRNYNSAIDFMFSGGGNLEMELSNGQKKTILNSAPDGMENFSIVLRKSETYTIKSVRNECGVGVAEGQKKIKVVGFKLQTLNLSDAYHASCEGNTIGFSKIVTGNLPGNAELKIQMSDAGGNNFTDIESYQITNLRETYAIIPNGLSGNPIRRKFRIVTTNYEGIFEPTDFITIKSKVTANLTGAKGESILSQIESLANMKISFTGSAPYYFNLNKPIDRTNSFNDDYLIKGYSTSNPYEFSVLPKSRNDVYELVNLSNGCGYGISTGKVSIASFKASMTIQNYENNFSCADKEIELNCKTYGDFEANNTFTIRIVTFDSLKIYELLQTKSINGITRLKLPKNIIPGLYYVEVSSSAPYTSTRASYHISAPANLKISGNTIINAGDITHILLTGKDRHAIPFSYTLSDGTKGEVSNMLLPEKISIPVEPKKTTEYKLTALSNACGEGTFEGSALVTVNPSSDKQVLTTYIETDANNICTGKKVYVYYETNKANDSEKFIVQISDENGNNFKDYPTTGRYPLVVEIPSDFKVGNDYRIRVVSNDSSRSSSAFILPLQILQRSTAKLLGNNLSVLTDESSTVNILTTGPTGKYVYLGIDSLSTKGIYSEDSVFRIEIPAAKTQQVYTLFGVFDVFCGYGKVIGDNKLVIDLITAQENPQAEFVIYPNPATHIIQIKNLGGIQSEISLTNIAGIKSIQSIKVEEGRTDYELNVQYLPAGTYLLSVEQKNKTYIRKIIKQ